MKSKISMAGFFQLLWILSMPIDGHSQSLSPDKIRELLVKDWQRAKEFTLEYLDAMPADKYGFRAVDSIRSFAQQMIHLAQSNVFLMSHATGQPSLGFAMVDLEHNPAVQAKDSVRYYVITSYDYCIDVVSKFDTNKWGELTKFFSFEETRLAFMMKVFEHQVHHRGQTTIYIRLQGIRPPPEK